MFKRLFLILAALLVGLACTARPASAGAQAEFKFALPTGQGHIYTLGSEFFKQRVEELTQERIIVHLYPGGQLSGDQRVLTENIQMGAVDMTTTSSGALSGFNKNFLLCSLPYLFSNADYCMSVMNGPVGKMLTDPLERFNLKTVGWWPAGLQCITNSRRPIHSVEDMRGLKIRTMENPLLIALYTSWNALPTPMALGEVLTALQQGTIDGQENTETNTYANKFHEVQKYLAMTNHYFTPSPFFVSKSKFDAMPADLQELFLKAAVDANEFALAEYHRQSASAVDNMRKEGLEVTYPDLEGFRKTAFAIYPQFVKELDPEVAALIPEIRAGHP